MQKVCFEAREENLNTFCPLCGTCSLSSKGEVTGCLHLVYVWLNLADPPMMYCREDIKELIKDIDFSSPLDFEDILNEYIKDKNNSDFLEIEEFMMPPASAQLFICYEYMDDE